MKTTLKIVMENMGNTSTDGIQFLVKLVEKNELETPDIIIEGDADYIISANSFHLSTELADACLEIGLDDYELVLALEDRKESVTFQKIERGLHEVIICSRDKNAVGKLNKSMTTTRSYWFPLKKQPEIFVDAMRGEVGFISSEIKYANSED